MPMKAMTTASAEQYDAILYGRMTPAMAAAYLQDGRVCLRTFGQTLCEMYPASDLLDRLTAFFVAITAQPDRRSIQRKIRNWLTTKHCPSSRQDIFAIAFALNLSEAQLDYLLSLATDYGIQYRDARDAVFAWFLRGGYSWAQATEFFSRLPEPPGLNQVSGQEASRLTQDIHSEFLLAHSLPELEACCLRNLPRFGDLHLRAYYYFDLYMRQLIHPASPWEDEPERDYSLELVMDTYLCAHMPRGKDRKGYSLVQRLIKQNWPNATTIKNVFLHKEDVPRKLLLLLYVVTENIGVHENAYFDLEDDEEPLTVEERVDDHWWTLNALLADCGMAPLDPRNATDWLFLYAMCADPDEAMSDRLEQVIDAMFDNVREK